MASLLPDVKADDWLHRPAVTEAETVALAPQWLELAKPEDAVVGVQATLILERTRERLAEVEEAATLRVPVPSSVSASMPWLSDGIRHAFFEKTADHIFVPRAMGLARYGLPSVDQRITGRAWPPPPAGAGPHGAGLPAPYPAQRKVIDAVAAATSGDRRLLNMGVVKVPCGMGKTNVAMHTLARWGIVSWLMAPNITICGQIAASARAAFPHLVVSELHSGVPSRRRPAIIAESHIVVATLQTAAKVDAAQVAHVGGVIVDECHHAPAKTLSKAIMRFGALRMLGMTATLTRSDGLTPAIEWLLGPTVANMRRGPTPGQGFLIKYSPAIKRRRREEVGSEATPVGSPADATSLAEAQTLVVADPVRNRMILDAILQLAQAAHEARFTVTGRPGVARPKVIALFPRRAHAIALAKAVGAAMKPGWESTARGEMSPDDVTIPVLDERARAAWAGLSPSLYVGSMSAADRRAAARDCSVFFCTDVVAREGLHMDPVYALFNASWVASEGVMEQLLGRAARVNCLLRASRVVLLQDPLVSSAYSIFRGQRSAVERQGWSLVPWTVVSGGTLPEHEPSWQDPARRPQQARRRPPPGPAVPSVRAMLAAQAAKGKGGM